MIETTESVVRTRPEDVAVALLTSGTCKSFKVGEICLRRFAELEGEEELAAWRPILYYDNLIPAARLCSLWVEGGDQTTGWHYASSIDYPADFPVEGEDVFNFILTYTNKVAEEIDVLASSLAPISGVEELKVQETKSGFEIWIVVNNASEEGRYAIYEAEWELMRRFPDRIFDFHLIDREEMDLSSIVTFSDGTLTISIGRRDYA